jgi:hypothetical protein
LREFDFFFGRIISSFVRTKGSYFPSGLHCGWPSFFSPNVNCVGSVPPTKSSRYKWRIVIFIVVLHRLACDHHHGLVAIRRDLDLIGRSDLHQICGDNGRLGLRKCNGDRPNKKEEAENSFHSDNLRMTESY